MIHEKDLTKSDKNSLKYIDRINKVLIYLYSGNTLYYNGRYYRMDGDFNPYIVSMKNDSKKPMDKGTELFPIFQNSEFWDVIVDFVHGMSEEDLQKISLESAVIKTLNRTKIK